MGRASAVGGYAVQPAKADGFRVIADAAPKDELLVKELGADVVLPRGTEIPELVRGETSDGVNGLVDTAGIASLAIRAVRDGSRVASSVGGTQAPAERGIEIRYTFAPQCTPEHAKLDRLRRPAETDSITPRVTQSLPAEQATEAHQLLEVGGLRGRVVLTLRERQPRTHDRPAHARSAKATVGAPSCVRPPRRALFRADTIQFCCGGAWAAPFPRWR